jgi:hypothetical protein
MAITFHIGIVAAFAPASSPKTLINIHLCTMPADESVESRIFEAWESVVSPANVIVADNTRKMSASVAM